MPVNTGEGGLVSTYSKGSDSSLAVFSPPLGPVRGNLPSVTLAVASPVYCVSRTENVKVLQCGTAA